MRVSDSCRRLGIDGGVSWSLWVVDWVFGKVDVIPGWLLGRLLRGWVQRQQSQIRLPLGWLAPSSTRIQPAARSAARAFLMVWGQHPRSAARRALDG